MKLKRFYPLAIFIGVAVIATADILSDNGKAGRTGSPGETNCTGCHNSYALGAGGGSLTITASNMPNWQYVPGQVYHLTATVTRSGNSLFGIGFEALKASGNTPTGTFTITNTASTTIKSVTVSGASRPNVVHKLNGGTGSGSKAFTFDWTAPSTNVGNIVFYASGNACNNNGSEFGDYVYAASQTITPAVTTGIAANDNAKGNLKVYPNPVHENITIEYFIDSPAQVQVWLTSLAGNKILSLLNETQFGGNYIQNFNIGSKVAKGVYLICIDVDGKRETKKIIVN